MAPGPELAGVLAGVDVSRLSGFDLVEVLKARYRQGNHERARLMATMVEVGLCDVGPDDELPRRAVPDEFAADEVRAALVWTRRAAEAQFGLAYDLATRLPAVHAAMDAGAVDEPRARVLSEWTSDLTGQQARALCDALLDRVPELTTGQLVDQIKKMAIAIDPEWARRRYEDAVAGRRVVGSRNPDGSANLSGYDLPVDRVAAAGARINALAKAAKRAGHPDPIDHVRADVFLGMTDGTYAGLTDAAILDDLLAATRSADPPQADPPGPGADEPGPGGTDPGQAARRAGDQTGGDTGGGPHSAGHGGRGGLELRVRLSTLLGRDEYPAELAGWGPVHAELARDLAAALRGAQWWCAITDDRGQLLYSGIIRARPTSTPPGTAAVPAADIVELRVSATALRTLARDTSVRLGCWSRVVAELADQHAGARADRFAADAPRRAPGAALLRHVQIRDQFCRFRGCGTPARAADTDHTHDHGWGGITTDGNLGAACRHDHRLKHEGGWRLTQPQPGLFEWTSRLGHTYRVRPPPIIEPLPDPQPRRWPHWPPHTAADDGRDSPILDAPPAAEPAPKRPDPDPGIPPY